MDSFAFKELAKATIDTGATAVTGLASRIDDTFVTACQRTPPPAQRREWSE